MVTRHQARLTKMPMRIVGLYPSEEARSEGFGKGGQIDNHNSQLPFV